MVTANGKLCMWTVYDKPTDFPTEFVARRWMVDQPTEVLLRAETLDRLRAKIHDADQGLICIPRFKEDEPQIVEVWI